MMSLSILAKAYSVLILSTILCQGGLSTADEITLEQIMADPDWIGNAPENPYWADDSESIYYYQKVEGEERRELFEINLDGEILRTVAPEDKSLADTSDGDFSGDRLRKVYTRNGDVFIKNLESGRIQQLTRTEDTESRAAFMFGDDAVQFARGDAIYVRNLETGVEYQAADLRTEDDPESKEEETGFLRDQQLKLFETLRENKAEREEREERLRRERAADPMRLPLPWYLGKKYEIEGTSLGPRGDWMLVRVVDTSKRKEGGRGTMPNYVTETGYVAQETVRRRVGTSDLPTEELLLLDLAGHETHFLAMSDLPELEARRLEAADDASEDASGPRPFVVWRTVWNRAGTQVALDIFSRDNKDRWIAAVDLTKKRIRPLHHETDEAWINTRRTELEWLPDDEMLYIVSELMGYSHLYTLDPTTGLRRQLTDGAYEVSYAEPSHGGRSIYYRANKTHPGVYEFHRVDISTRKSQRLTDLGGNNRFYLSPDESQILALHSTVTRPYELYVQPNEPGADERRLTHTVSETFESIDWVAPEIVEIPSHQAERSIYSRLYLPDGPAQSPRPAVVFIHGAGYLQNAHMGWSSYFREFMFHTLLVNRGYVVLDMDYRASAGYGRDWRTAIYRRMGTPELEDLEVGVAWLVENHNVDGGRVGVYGGSYGGFLTLMALFRKPELFACGAALRPVTDWAHYNHGYTSNILNIPELDPEAFKESSPIYYAEGLTKPLLICHGMQDSNVFYQDSVRLAQRLIELGKEDWEFASYPLEGHGFEEPASWLDEYRRILKLFESHLK